MGDSLTVALTERGDLVGYRWPPPAQGPEGDRPPALFSFNGIGALDSPPHPPSGEQSPAVGGSAEWPGAEAGAPRTAEDSEDDDRQDDEEAAEASATATNRVGDLPRRAGVRPVHRPTATPVPGRGTAAPAARQVDLTRRAPVAVVPKRPDGRVDPPVDRRESAAGPPDAGRGRGDDQERN